MLCNPNVRAKNMGGRARNVMVVIAIICVAVSHGNLQGDIDACRPQQVHLSYGETTSQMIIMWSTEGQCSTKVKYGTQPFGLDDISPGDSRLYNEPANKDGVKYLHRVLLRNLLPNSVFFYQPYSNDVAVGPFFFKTPANDMTDMELLTLGDLSTTSNIFTSLSRVVSDGKYSALIHPGNMAIDLSSKGGKNGDLYMKLMESSLKMIPYMTAPGPAESDNDTFSQYRHRFSMPLTEWPMTPDRMWYSIDLGPVHLVSYSTEVFRSDGKYAPTQHNWLIKDLEVANSNRQKTPWIIAFGHCPMYCASQDPALTCSKQKSKIAQELEDIMYHWGVDVIVSSSGLGNEISYPMYKGVKVGDDFRHPLAPIHISVSSATPWKAKYNSTEEEWLHYSDNDDTPINFGRLQIHNSSLIRFEIVSFESYKVIESVEIVQHDHKKFSKDDLPANISAKINKEIEVSGGDPGSMNIEETTSPKPVSTISKKISEILQGDNRNKIIIGVSVAGAILLVVVALLIVRRVMRGRRRHSSRRWENMDINYGKRYYNKAPEKDDLENDFEIDMAETTAPSRKLLSDD